MDHMDDMDKDCYSEEYTEAYQSGYDRGYDDGFEDGYDECIMDDFDDDPIEAAYPVPNFDFSDFDDLVKLLEDHPENDSTLYYND